MSVIQLTWKQDTVFTSTVCAVICSTVYNNKESLVPHDEAIQEAPPSLWYCSKWQSKCPYKSAYALLSIVWAPIMQTFWYPRLLYSNEYAYPWLMFNFCAVSATVKLLSSKITILASSRFLPLVNFEDVTSVLHHTHLSRFASTLLSKHIHFYKKEHCPHMKHTNMCEMQHLACLLLLKNIPRYSLLSFYKLKMTQPCFLLISNSYQEHSQDLHCAECHITSYSAENSQRFTSTSERQQKCRNFSKIPRMCIHAVV